MSASPRHLLICRTDALGDALLALPMAAALKRAWPQARVTFLASDYAQPLLSGQANLDHVWAYAPRGAHAGAAGLRGLSALIRSGRFDAALLAFPDPRVSWAVWRARVPVRVGTGRRWWSWLYSLRVPHSRSGGGRHEADYNLDLVRALGVFARLDPPRLRVAAADRAWARTYLRRLGLRSTQRLVVLHPGSHGSAANWPPQRYGEAACRLLQVKGVRVLLTGSAAEQDLLRITAQAVKPKPWCLTETLTLPRFAAVLASAAVFVSSNTGPMHVASALGVPTVSIFPPAGVTGPERWQPLGKPRIVLTPPGRDVLDIPARNVVEAVRVFIHARDRSRR